MLDSDLLDRVDAEAARLGQTRRVFVERAVVAALEGSGSGNFKLGAPRVETAAPRRPRAGKAKKESAPKTDGGVTELPKIAPRRWA